MSIAAVIPLYNGSPFIEKTIESVLAQTEPADDILVVDDGSTDDGPQIVEALARSHPVTLLRKANGGQSSARNFAIRHTRCTHIAFLDQDDAWYDDHLSVLKRPFLDSSVRNLAVTYGNLDRIARDGKMVASRYLDNIPTPQPKTSLEQCLGHDMFILPSASLVSKEAIDSVGFFDEQLTGYEDDDLFCRIFSAGYRFVYVDEAVTKWRLYSSSTSFSPVMARSRMTYFKKQLALHPDDPGLGVYWARDIIAPRFMRLASGEFVKATKNRDALGLQRSLSEMEAIAPSMSPRAFRRMKTYAPIMRGLCRLRMYGAARSLAKRTARS